jgi:uncharacterized protein (TIGR03437 family)
MLLLAAAPALAQFSQLAVTDDGTQLYFTSQLLLQGMTTPSKPVAPEFRLYMAGGAGVSLFAERGSLASQRGATGDSGVAAPEVSGDGSLVAFTFNDICLTDPLCPAPVSEGEIRGQQTLDLGPGSVQLSRNGHWALLTQTIISVSGTPPNSTETTTYASTLIDLTTGQRTQVPSPPNLATHTLASNGTMLVQNPASGRLSVWNQGQLSSALFPSGVSFSLPSLTLSDDGSTILFTGFPKPSNAAGLPGLSVMALDIESGNLTTLYQAPDSAHNATFMSASADGQTTLFRVNRWNALNGPAYLATMSGGQIFPINLPDGEYVSDGTLTGPGDMAFLVTTAGRIVKVTVATGEIASVFPAVPFCDWPSGLAAGSLATLPCSVNETVADLQGRVLIDGNVAPVLLAGPGWITIQVPWHVPTNPWSSLVLEIPSSSPFQAVSPVTIAPYFARFLAAYPSQSALLGLDIVKGDWSGLLTTQPGPGDVVYLYMTGLGPVQYPVATGEAASLTVPDPITGTFTCQFRPQAEPSTTLFAGLAPGTIGLYQVALQLPADAGAAPITGISCALKTD